MRCPQCRIVELRRVRAKGTDLELDVCPKCKGSWFDEDELESVLEAPARNLKPRGKVRRTQMPCPRCGARMREFYYPRTFVTIDQCRECGGMWLDGGEFKEINQVREYLERMGRLEAESPGGVKGALLRFIDRAMNSIVYS